tara:strand:+ start:335 stop:736 length:402 start_codon:yes stop_codon:yes gene_type:complete
MINKYSTCLKSGEFQLKWQQMIFQLAQQLKKEGEIIFKVEEVYTGGGCYHFHMRNSEDKIYSIHGESIIDIESYRVNNVLVKHFKWFYEKSHLSYKSIDDYYKDEKYGFGYEYNSPNYEERIFKMESIINTQG